MSDLVHLEPLALDTKAISEDGTFSGYASTWQVDQGRDQVVKGAFAKSLAERPAIRVKMLRDHLRDQVVGIWTGLTEDSRGLKATGKIVLETTLGRETHALMKAGALDGLSIGFRVRKDRFDRTKGVRFLEEIDLREISITAFPMNEAAVVTAVKSSEHRAARIAAAIQRAARAIR